LRQNRDLFSLNTEIFSWKTDLQFFRRGRIFSSTANSLTNGARIYLTQRLVNISSKNKTHMILHAFTSLQGHVKETSRTAWGFS